MHVGDTIARDLTNEPQSVVKVAQRDTLRADLTDYVLTDGLARDFVKALEPFVEATRPGGRETDNIGVWISGFYGSGKSHFAKLAGHLLGNTRLGDATARDFFANLLHTERPADRRLRDLLGQATAQGLSCHLVTFDVSALTRGGERNVGLTFLRGLYESLGLSPLPAFAEAELELQAAEPDHRRYKAFLQLYEEKTGIPWCEDKELSSSSARFAECLAELLPSRFPSADLAHDSLELGLQQFADLSVEDAVSRMLRWLGPVGPDRQGRRLVFVADEIGAWARQNASRIEQIRALVETLGTRGSGRIWLIVTSQEKLSSLVQDVADSRHLLQRLEARFRVNVHLESSEVGAVIEDRILQKRPTAVPDLEALWQQHHQRILDVAQSPGLELGKAYPRAERESFVRDYPFLPYQVAAAADVFDAMRGMRVSSGARTMIGVTFDATRDLAGRDLGAVVSWDVIFDAANRDNEFADEQYLGSLGLSYIAGADAEVTDAPLQRPSRLLKTLWLTQQRPAIPRTVRNLARLLVSALDQDILALERDVEATLQLLARHNYVRQDVATGHWRYLSQDEVTVEKIVARIAEDVRAKEVRAEIVRLHQDALRSLFGGRITVGQSNTPFDYGLYLNDVALKNETAPVQLRAAMAGTDSAEIAIESNTVDLDAPVVYWVVETAPKLEERLRRALAIERLPNDDEYRQVATRKMDIEVEKLQLEAGELRDDAATSVSRLFQGGTLYWGGDTVPLDPTTSVVAKTAVEDALRDRIRALYDRYSEGDRAFTATNVDKLFVVPARDRGALDPALGLFDAEGHVHGGNVLVEELGRYLKSSLKTSGADVADGFARVPFGWPADLLRYTAAAMFVDGKLVATDKAGKPHDDYKETGARALFGTQAFKTTRLEVEEGSLAPRESDDAVRLLAELGQPATDGGEVALKEAALQLAARLNTRLIVLQKAREAALPLPDEYDLFAPAIETIVDAGSRVKVVRALLAHGATLRKASQALDRLETFEREGRFAQYRRSQALLQAAIQAGLEEDPTWGERVRTAAREMAALKEQRRVVEEWNGAYQDYRQDVLDAFKAVYAPLREELHRRIEEARSRVTAMHEFARLGVGDQTMVRVAFLNEGKGLAEVSLPELRDEQQLLRANEGYSIAHMRSALAALESQVGSAQERIIALYTQQQEQQGQQAKLATWSPTVFAGQRLTTTKEVDALFDREKERVKTLIRAGKVVQVI